jgi:hypothetical protein
MTRQELIEYTDVVTTEKCRLEAAFELGRAQITRLQAQPHKTADQITAIYRLQDKTYCDAVQANTKLCLEIETKTGINVFVQNGEAESNGLKGRAWAEHLLANVPTTD